MRIDGISRAFRLISPFAPLIAIWFALQPTTVYAQNSIPPVLLCVVQHESGAKQFKADGTPLISPTDDVGFMQINIPTWLSTARGMGLDIINSEADNIEFGIWLYNTHGIGQWSTYKEYCSGSAGG